MSTYIPKIVIAQFANTKKAKVENANGEVTLILEKNFDSKARNTGQYPKRL